MLKSYFISKVGGVEGEVQNWWWLVGRNRGGEKWNGAFTKSFQLLLV